MATKRKALSKKTRFEVFKRDLFTCQYCGKKSPDAVLEVDHIHPISKGGDNSIENLVTSCFACNRGKRDNKLSDGSVVEKSRKQLELNQEKINQIDMIFKWKQSMENTNNYMVDKLLELFRDKTKCAKADFSPNFRRKLQKAIKSFGFDLMIESTIISINQYYRNENDLVSVASKICGIANNKHDDEYDIPKASLRRVFYEIKKVYKWVDGRIFYMSSIAKYYDPSFEQEIINMLKKYFNELDFYGFDKLIEDTVMKEK